VVEEMQLDVLRHSEVEGGFFSRHVLRGRLDGEKIALDAAM
jgi:hypothetical protein